MKLIFVIKDKNEIVDTKPIEWTFPVPNKGDVILLRNIPESLIVSSTVIEEQQDNTFTWVISVHKLNNY